MAKDRFKTEQVNPYLAWIAVGVLLILVVGLLAAYVLRPERSSADDARTAAAIGKMDQSQNEANARREEKRGADSLLN